MEFLIDSWEWIKINEFGHIGLIYTVAVLAAIIFRWDKKLKKPKK